MGNGLERRKDVRRRSPSLSDSWWLGECGQGGAGGKHVGMDNARK